MGSRHPVSTAEVFRWQGDLEPGIQTMVYAGPSPLGVWSRAGSIVSLRRSLCVSLAQGWHTVRIRILEGNWDGGDDDDTAKAIAILPTATAAGKRRISAGRCTALAGIPGKTAER
jgi:hypothetical protein